MQVPWEELKVTLYSALKDVERGEVITITRNGEPVAELKPLKHKKLRMGFKVGSSGGRSAETVDA